MHAEDIWPPSKSALYPQKYANSSEKKARASSRRKEALAKRRVPATKLLCILRTQASAKCRRSSHCNIRWRVDLYIIRYICARTTHLRWLKALLSGPHRRAEALATGASDTKAAASEGQPIADPGAPVTKEAKEEAKLKDPEVIAANEEVTLRLGNLLAAATGFWGP